MTTNNLPFTEKQLKALQTKLEKEALKSAITDMFYNVLDHEELEERATKIGKRLIAESSDRINKAIEEKVRTCFEKRLKNMDVEISVFI